jgi:NAD+ synthase
MHRSTELSDWIREQVNASGARGIVVGLSGGIDSAVVLRLSQIAMEEQVIGVLMPCHSEPRDEADAKLVADHFKAATIRVDLAPAYDRLCSDLQAAMSQLPEAIGQPPAAASTDLRARIPVANIKPRLRMSVLYYIANSLNYLVAGTGNRSELLVGYFTKYGDGGVDILPLGNLLKSDVQTLARTLDVPSAIIEKPPSAGLWHGQTDEAEMGFSYDDLERYLTQGPQAVSPALAMRIERLVRVSEHKRALAPMPPTDGEEPIAPD